MDSSSAHSFSGYNGSEFITVMNAKKNLEAQCDAKEGEWHTLVSQRLTPPNAVIKYIIIIAIWTSVTSTLQKNSKIQNKFKKHHTDKFDKFNECRECTHNPKRSVPDTYVCQCAQKNMNMPTKPQKNIQLG